MYYSELMNGFIPAGWKDDGTYSAQTWPADAVLLTEEERVIFCGRAAPAGKVLGAENGRPSWVDLPPPKPLSREEIEALRLRAYADPVAGSDRFFAEAARMQAVGENGWEAVRTQGVTRFAEIQAEYPWP